MDDRDLAALVCGGQSQEFRAIVEKYAAPATALAMNVLGNREDAQDACQEAFIQVFRHIGEYDPRREFKNWFYAILYRRCLDTVRRRRRASRLYEIMKHEAPLVHHAPPRAEVLNPALREELLRSLSPKERTAISLWACEGYSAEEISRVMGASPSTARVVLFKARKKIKALLEKEHEGLRALSSVV